MYAPVISKIGSRPGRCALVRAARGAWRLAVTRLRAIVGRNVLRAASHMAIIVVYGHNDDQVDLRARRGDRPDTRADRATLEGVQVRSAETRDPRRGGGGRRRRCARGPRPAAGRPRVDARPR